MFHVSCPKPNPFLLRWLGLCIHLISLPSSKNHGFQYINISKLLVLNINTSNLSCCQKLKYFEQLFWQMACGRMRSHPEGEDSHLKHILTLYSTNGNKFRTDLCDTLTPFRIAKCFFTLPQIKNV